MSWDATINKRGTAGVVQWSLVYFVSVLNLVLLAGVYAPSGPPPASKLETLTNNAFKDNSVYSNKTLQQSTESIYGDPVTRKTSVDAFFHRCGGASLRQHDLGRIGDEISSHAVPGSANAKLIGGKYR